MSSTTQPLAGKLALITGASKGIGAATALELSSLGAKVVINYSSDNKPADDLVKKIGADKAIAIKANASSLPDIKRLVEETVKWGGEGRIDILIANAGTMLLGADLENTKEEDFAKTYDLNVKGPYFLCQVSLVLYPLNLTTFLFPRQVIAFPMSHLNRTCVSV
jgi:3-oxoacyl-[acyl-carrier protein] reductase